jgi:monoterpene epsilon-lactone hydrolase
MRSLQFRFLLLSLSLLLAPVLASLPALAQEGKTPEVTVDSTGTVHVPAQDVPMSDFLSPEAKAYVTLHLKQMQDPDVLVQDNGVPRFMKPYLERQKAIYAVDREDRKISGVHTYVYTPRNGVSAGNKNRVLINLHGGGFSGCWPGCAELESIPIAAIGRIEVISVDYREGPAYRFPAASEDVAAVYQELLKKYPPQDIGIYGCSAGGGLTAMSMAWFQRHNLPRPGAIGIFCAGAGGFDRLGDAAYTAMPLGEARVISGRLGTHPRPAYFEGTDPKDPLLAPLNSPEMLANFPPTLLISGTRGFELSDTLYTHTQLIKQGVEADLHVWEGLFHGFFYNPDVPESRDCYDVIVKFFDRHLGK